MRVIGKKGGGVFFRMSVRILLACLWAAVYSLLKVDGMIPRTFLGEFLLWVPLYIYWLLECLLAIRAKKAKRNSE
jgi:hypothetical protein